jgi:type I restriction enzyme R subunit
MTPFHYLVKEPARLDAGPTGFNYFDPGAPVSCYSGHLPHWCQQGTIYFVTFRLADSLPQSKLHQWTEERERWMREHPEPHDSETCREYYELFPQRLQRWLDAGFGRCVLEYPVVRNIVESAMAHFSAERYVLDSWVIMPNHVHAILTPLEDHLLSEILHSWKSFTATRINRYLGLSGALWQKESFDHIIRSPESHERIRAYIRQNPEGLRPGTYSLKM